MITIGLFSEMKLNYSHKIKVYNDYEVDAVYIDSEVNLDKFI